MSVSSISTSSTLNLPSMINWAMPKTVQLHSDPQPVLPNFVADYGNPIRTMPAYNQTVTRVDMRKLLGDYSTESLLYLLDYDPDTYTSDVLLPSIDSTLSAGETNVASDTTTSNRLNIEDFLNLVDKMPNRYGYSDRFGIIPELDSRFSITKVENIQNVLQDILELSTNPNILAKQQNVSILESVGKLEYPMDLRSTMDQLIEETEKAKEKRQALQYSKAPQLQEEISEAVPAPPRLSDKDMAMIQELVKRDQEVRMHELAHSARGSGLTGSPSFVYQVGPDGKQYAIGGEVQIRIVPGATPEESMSNAQQVISAATAPSNPSAADMQAAMMAQQMFLDAQRQMAQETKESQPSIAAKFAEQPPPFSMDQATNKGKDPFTNEIQSDDRIFGIENTIDAFTQKDTDKTQVATEHSVWEKQQGQSNQQDSGIEMGYDTVTPESEHPLAVHSKLDRFVADSEKEKYEPEAAAEAVRMELLYAQKTRFIEENINQVDEAKIEKSREAFPNVLFTEQRRKQGMLDLERRLELQDQHITDNTAIKEKANKNDAEIAQNFDATQRYQDFLNFVQENKDTNDNFVEKRKTTKEITPEIGKQGVIKEIPQNTLLSQRELGRRPLVGEFQGQGSSMYGQDGQGQTTVTPSSQTWTGQMSMLQEKKQQQEDTFQQLQNTFFTNQRSRQVNPIEKQMPLSLSGLGTNNTQELVSTEQHAQLAEQVASDPSLLSDNLISVVAVLQPNTNQIRKSSESIDRDRSNQPPLGVAGVEIQSLRAVQAIAQVFDT